MFTTEKQDKMVNPVEICLKSVSEASERKQASEMAPARPSLLWKRFSFFFFFFPVSCATRLIQQTASLCGLSLARLCVSFASLSSPSYTSLLSTHPPLQKPLPFTQVISLQEESFWVASALFFDHSHSPGQS